MTTEAVSLCVCCRWKQYATKNWPIGLSAALRLRAILRHFADDASLYFAKTAPGAGCDVSWPVGYVVEASRGGTQ
jgi:hypothetical protein